MDDWLVRHLPEWMESFDSRPFRCTNSAQVKDLDLTVVFAVSSHPTRFGSRYIPRTQH